MAGACMVAMNCSAPAPSGSCVINGINSAISAPMAGASPTSAARSVNILFIPYFARMPADVTPALGAGTAGRLTVHARRRLVAPQELPQPDHAHFIIAPGPVGVASKHLQ